jgi:hypothetical protein
MNSLQLTLTEADVRTLLDDMDLRIVTSKFKGKGIPEVVVVTIVKDKKQHKVVYIDDPLKKDQEDHPNTMDMFKHQAEHGQKESA